MKRSLIIAAVLLLLALAVLAQWPARQAAQVLGLEAMGASATRWDGTLWKGGADGLQVRGVRLGELDWTLQPASLLRLSPTLSLRVDGPEINASAVVESDLTGSNLLASGVEVSAPAHWLQHVIGQPFLQLAGTIDARLATVRVEDGWLTGISGVTRWQDAVVTGRIRAPLGALRIDWVETPNGSVGTLSDSGGPLRIAGTVTIENRQYVVDATLNAAADNIPVRQALEVLGRPDASGAVRLAISGPMVPIR
ncbi:MAG: type II secretion system protein N [Pseudomonadota bacterium]